MLLVVFNNLPDLSSEALHSIDVHKKLGTLEDLEGCRGHLRDTGDELNGAVASYGDGGFSKKILFPMPVDSDSQVRATSDSIDTRLQVSFASLRDCLPSHATRSSSLPLFPLLQDLLRSSIATHAHHSAFTISLVVVDLHLVSVIFHMSDLFRSYISEVAHLERVPWVW